MADLEGVAPEVGGELAPSNGCAATAGASAGHDTSGRSSSPTCSQTRLVVRAGRLAEQLRHPGQDVVHRVRAADPVGELGQHLVRGRPLPYTTRSASAVRARTEEVERRRRARRARAGWDQLERAAVPTRTPTRGTRRGPATATKRRPGSVLHGLLDDDVEVPEAVAEDRDQVGDGMPTASVSAVAPKRYRRRAASSSPRNSNDEPEDPLEAEERAGHGRDVRRSIASADDPHRWSA